MSRPAARRLADLPATELVAGYADGSLSPVAVVEDVLARIDDLEDHVGALYAPDPDTARQAAAAAARRWERGGPAGPIDGVPITLKENIPTRGVPVPSGTAATEAAGELVPAERDGPPAARVREAGAVLLAKTTMPDWGMMSSGLSSFHQLARNPWDLATNPGGSSAGACAAGAAGYGPLHVGSDIGGSLRLPAAWTALVTLKPTWGRVPVDPPYWGRVVGPIARTAADCAMLLDVLAGADPDDRDHLSLPPATRWDPATRAMVGDGRGPSSHATPDRPFDPAGLRIAHLRDAGAGMDVEDEVATAVDRAVAVFADAGAEVEVVEPWFSEDMLADLDLFWRVRGHQRHRGLPPEARAAMLDYIVEWVAGGADVPGHVVMRAANRQLEVGAATISATRPFHLVLSPVSPNSAFPATWPGPANDVTRAMSHIAFTVPYNFSHQPAVSTNAGFTSDGAPVGLQIAGPRFADHVVLAAAAWFERRRPDDCSPAWPAPGVVDLEV